MSSYNSPETEAGELLWPTDLKLHLDSKKSSTYIEAMIAKPNKSLSWLHAHDIFLSIYALEKKGKWNSRDGQRLQVKGECGSSCGVDLLASDTS